ncbi:MAG: leucine-rich repeat protein, partial [Clostridia bacterium]|nr:leucine-rich repeat protein [Clostridia bacterium]
IIDDELFEYTGEDTDVTIPEEVATIDDFAIPAKVRSIRFGAHVKAIEAEAFGSLYEETDLETIYYDGTIEDWMNIEFGGYLSSIDDLGPVSGNPMLRAKKVYFQGKLLEDIVVPSSVKEIGAGQFQGFEQAHSIRFGPNVKKIGVAAMKWSHIEAIYFDGTVEEWRAIKRGKECFPKMFDLYVQGQLVKPATSSSTAW